MRDMFTYALQSADEKNVQFRVLFQKNARSSLKFSKGSRFLEQRPNNFAISSEYLISKVLLDSCSCNLIISKINIHW